MMILYEIHGVSVKGAASRPQPGSCLYCKITQEDVYKEQSGSTGAVVILKYLLLKKKKNIAALFR